MKSLSDKAALLQSGAFKAPENIEEVNMTPLDLFKVIHLTPDILIAFQEIWS